jgi:hypothetical protein
MSVQQIVRQTTDLPLLIGEWQEQINGLVATCLRQEHVGDTISRELNELQTEYLGAPS